MIAEAVAALGLTFQSGAFDAWLVNHLNDAGHNKLLNKVLSWRQALRSLAVIAGTMIGGYVGDIDLSLPWLFGAVSMAVTLVLALFVMDESSIITKNLHRRSGYIAKSKQALKIVVSNRLLLFVAIAGFLYNFMLQTPNMQWQPIFQPYVGGTTGLGYIMTVAMLVMTFGGVASNFIARRTKCAYSTITVMQILVGLGIMATVWSSNIWIMLTPFMFHELIRSAYAITYSLELNNQINGTDECVRATVLSLEKTTCNLGGVAGLFVSGYVALHWSIPLTWQVFGLGLIIGSFALWLINKYLP